MDVPVILEYALTLTTTFKYLLIFIGVIIEGPVLMIAAGFLIHLGLFEPLPLFFTILAGDLVGDIVWYYIGYYFAEPFMRKHGHFLSLTPERLEKIKELFHRYHERILIFSKLTVGFGLALGTLIVAGITRIPFRRYMALNVVGESMLVAILLTLGYFFGEIFKYVDKSLKIGFIVIVSILVIGAFYGFARYMKKKVDSM